MEVNSEERLGIYSDFIGEYYNAVDSAFCREVINAFDYYQDMGSVHCEDDQFPDANAGRFDWAIDMFNLQTFMEGYPLKHFNEALWKCWEEYTHTYGHIKNLPMYSLHQKVQKTPAGGGYHVWHDESSDLGHCQRIMVWMMYLNDDYEGGEFILDGETLDKEIGELFTFKRDVPHEVLPVTKGVRLSLHFSVREKKDGNNI